MHPKITPPGHNFHWKGNDDWQTLSAGDLEKGVETANMLKLENVKSVSFRYPNDKSSASLPGPIGETPIDTHDLFAYGMQVNPVQVLKTIACLRYQSCEHPGWKESEAFAFLASLEQSAIRALPGYGECEWGAPDRKAKRSA